MATRPRTKPNGGNRVLNKKAADIIIIGGGICGASLALLCERAGLEVILVDRKIQSKKLKKSTKASAWVSALNRTSEKLLIKLGVWEQLIKDKQAASYLDMQVNTSLHNNELHLSAEMIGADNLGHIVDNSHLKQLLWQQLHQSKNIHPIEATPKSWDSEAKILATNCDKQYHAPLLIGCDGNNSWVREHVEIAIKDNSIKDDAYISVCTHAIAHNRTARQCFFDHGVIASLPLWDPHQSVLVYSVKKQEQPQDEEAFLLAAAAKAFGALQPKEVGSVVKHCIQSYHAEKYYNKHAILLGDAAMSVHPLAGLGLNCGLQAVIVLAEQINSAYAAERLDSTDKIGRLYENKIRGYNALTQSYLNKIYHCLITEKASWQSILSKLAFVASENTDLIKRQMIYHALYGLEAYQY